MSTLFPSSTPATLLVDAPPLRRPTQRNRGDRTFFGVVTGGVLLVPMLVFVFLAVLMVGAWPAVQQFGGRFIWSTEWDANAAGGAAFGALPFIYGTVVTGVFALALAAPVGIGVATFLSEIDTGDWSYAVCAFVAIPVMAFMAPVVTMTDFAASGWLLRAMLGFLVAGGVALRFLRGPARPWCVAVLGLPVILLSARLVTGERVTRLPFNVVAIGAAVVGAVFVIRKARSVMPFLLEILATIPSVVYGMWGLFILAPWIAEHVQPYAKEHWQPVIDSIFGMSSVRIRGKFVPNFPLFWYPGFPNGLGLGTAILVLSIMILPMIVSISLDSLRAVPKSYREAALGLGATRWEMIRMAVLPPARSGLFGACILALGRALGETMAVTMVIGNDTRIGYSVFGKGYSIASIIANEYGEADGLKLSALMLLAFILFVITLTVNLLARLLVHRPVTDKPRRFRPVHWAFKYTGLLLIFNGVARIWASLRDGLLRVLRMSNAAWRRFKNRVAIGTMGALVMICLVPLGALMYALLRDGGSYVSVAFLTHLPKPPGEIGGGIGNAILGSFLLLVFSAVFAVPLGLAAGIYLTQRPATRLAWFTRLLLDVLSGIPAIIVGVFIYAVVVRGSGFSIRLGLSTLAGAMALGMIMLPIFARATEEALKAIPKTVDEAGLGLGLPRRTVVLRILVRAAMPAILTGLFLALARIGGEAAPLLFTTQSSNFWPDHRLIDLLQLEPLRKPVASLPLIIFEYSKSPYEDWKAQAWGASLVLVCLVLAIRLSTRAYTAWRYGGKEAHV
ncbi:MAG TPA: phosphate ABC transporter permease subunit PstC [Tepidisphaeraceae bacterium]